MLMDSYSPELKKVVFPNGRIACLLEVIPTSSAVDVVRWLDLPPNRLTLSMHVGASEFTPEKPLKNLLVQSVMRFAEDNQALVADGGTDAGVMQVIGEAYAEAAATFPLVGITVKNSVTYPGGPEPEQGRWPLNEYHTHFVIVEANDFGAESHLLVEISRSFGTPGIALVVNGGQIVRNEIEMHARIGTPVIVLKGTGRYADELANAAPESDLRQPFTEGAVLEIFDINTQPAEDLYHLLRRLWLR